MLCSETKAKLRVSPVNDRGANPIHTCSGDAPGDGTMPSTYSVDMNLGMIGYGEAKSFLRAHFC
jgi:hypothetical protein